jgi:hypothetical protein
MNAQIKTNRFTADEDEAEAIQTRLISINCLAFRRCLQQIIMVENLQKITQKSRAFPFPRNTP